MVIQSPESVNGVRFVVALKWGEEQHFGLAVQIPVKLRDRLMAASKQGAVSINTLTNTALRHRLAEEGDATIKGRMTVSGSVPPSSKRAPYGGVRNTLLTGAVSG